MTLKEYIVVNHGDAGICLWNREQWFIHLADARKSSPNYDPPIITTFNADEQLTEPPQPVPAGEVLPRSIEEMIAKEPVTFFLANALKYLDENQRIALRDALIERTPKQEDK